MERTREVAKQGSGGGGERYSKVIIKSVEANIKDGRQATNFHSFLSVHFGLQGRVRDH